MNVDGSVRMSKAQLERIRSFSTTTLLHDTQLHRLDPYLSFYPATPGPNIAEMSKPSALVVCLGNICRSPMGEAVLRHVAKERGVDLEVDSAGTAVYHISEEPDERCDVESKSEDGEKG